MPSSLKCCHIQLVSEGILWPTLQPSLLLQAGPAVLYGVIVVIQSLVAIQLMTACVYISPTQDLAYVLATGYGPSARAG